jgi:hypothetical protein
LLSFAKAAPAGAVERVMERGAARVTGINETTRDKINEAIGRGLDSGMSVLQVADAIQSGGVIDGLNMGSLFDDYRAEMIARTELMDAYNATALASYSEAGVSQVQAIDGDGDEECAARDGQTFDIDEADTIEDHPNGTLDWVPIVGEEPGAAAAEGAVAGEMPTEELPPEFMQTVGPEELQSLTTDLVDSARAAEPGVTEDLKAIGQLADLNPDAHFVLDGKELNTLKAAVKEEGSTLRKLNGMVKDDPMITRDQMAAEMKDNLRYTFVGDPASYDASVRTAVDELVARGYEPYRATNYWERADGYAGLNTNWRTADGQMFEIQFHTQYGLETKEVLSHPLYEEQRLLPADSPRRLEIDNEVNALWRTFRDAEVNGGLGDLPWLDEVFPIVR